MSLRFDVLTLFPEIFSGYMTQSLLKLALDTSLVEIHLWNLRDWARSKHKSVDDRPFGGGPGMVLMCDPVFDCVEAVRQQGTGPGQLLMMTPAGERLTTPLVKELAREERLLLLCGRYEGFDERIREGLKPREISVGDFVCNGGEVPAMIVIDTVIRYVPGVLGDPESDRGVAQRPRQVGISPVHPTASVSRDGSARHPPQRRPPGGRPLARGTIPDPQSGPIDPTTRKSRE